MPLSDVFPVTNEFTLANKFPFSMDVIAYIQIIYYICSIYISDRESILLVSGLPQLEIFMPRRGIEPQWNAQRITDSLSVIAY